MKFICNKIYFFVFEFILVLNCGIFVYYNRDYFLRFYKWVFFIRMVYFLYRIFREEKLFKFMKYNYENSENFFCIFFFYIKMFIDNI